MLRGFKQENIFDRTVSSYGFKIKTTSSPASNDVGKERERV